MKDIIWLENWTIDRKKVRTYSLRRMRVGDMETKQLNHWQKCIYYS